MQAGNFVFTIWTFSWQFVYVFQPHTVEFFNAKHISEFSHTNSSESPVRIKRGDDG